jgi:hypothetical protein
MTIKYEKSSGNVFADLGFPNSEQELVKAKLTVQIYKLLTAKVARNYTTTNLGAYALSPPFGICGPLDGIFNDAWSRCESYR